jgi:hypothetical protein
MLGGLKTQNSKGAAAPLKNTPETISNASIIGAAFSSFLGKTTTLNYQSGINIG